MTPPTALIAEYLVLASSLKAKDPPAIYHRANQLAFQLAMELPPDLWRKVQHAIASNTVGPLWDVVIAAQGGNQLTQADAVWHKPGGGKPMGNA